MRCAMEYQAELHFLSELLKTFRLDLHLFDNDHLPGNYMPEHNWIGEILSKDASLDRVFLRFKKQCQPKVIYQIEDGFLCHHIAFLFKEDADNPVYAYIGPYSQDLITKQHITKLSENYRFTLQMNSQIEAYFQLLSILYTFCSILWDGAENFSTRQLRDFYTLHFDSFFKAASVKEPLDLSHDITYVEERYDIERRLMQAVASGQIPKAELIFSTLSKYQLESRTNNALRNTKNYLIILNTILRVAARNGDVPPFHIDKLSSSFAFKIESTASAASASALMKDMVRKYCLLVKNHSMKGYSLLVRKVLTQVDYDITADLGLKNLAGQLNVNPSYLSTLFKKETGSTLTTYVNQKRIEHAVFLLNTSDLQIQMIAQYSGIPDVNYFTKTFKKMIGITPKEYRNYISSSF